MQGAILSRANQEHVCHKRHACPTFKYLMLLSRAFKVLSFSFPDSDRKGHLTRLDRDSLDREGAVKQRGSLY